MKLGKIIALVVSAHLAIIALFFTHFGWQLGDQDNSQAGLGETGIVIPVTLESNGDTQNQLDQTDQATESTSETEKTNPPPETTETVTKPVSEPVTEPAPEPAPEPVSEPVSEPAPEPVTEPASPAVESAPEVATESAPETTPETTPESAPETAPAPTQTPESAPLSQQQVPSPGQDASKTSTAKASTARATTLAPTSQLTESPSRNKVAGQAKDKADGAANETSKKGSSHQTMTPDTSLTAARIDPNYLHRPNPIYPALSKRRQEQGKVLLRVSLDHQGAVTAIGIEQSSGYDRLDQAALEAVSKWRFLPAKRGTETIPWTVHVPIEFKHQN